MNKRVNFEDTIFILNARIRMIKDLLVLDTDPGLFLAKTVDDMEFLDKTLAVLLRSLLENDKFLEREEAFENLSELEWQFQQVLGEFMSGFAAASPLDRDKAAVFRRRSEERQKAAEQHPEVSRTEPLVSADELNELLKDF